MKDMKAVNWTKKNIGVGYLVPEKVKDMEWNTREGITRRVSKEVMVCIQAMARKNKFWFN